jgi:hypothetical protein
VHQVILLMGSFGRKKVGQHLLKKVEAHHQVIKILLLVNQKKDLISIHQNHHEQNQEVNFIRIQFPKNVLKRIKERAFLLKKEGINQLIRSLKAKEAQHQIALQVVENLEKEERKKNNSIVFFL